MDFFPAAKNAKNTYKNTHPPFDSNPQLPIVNQRTHHDTTEILIISLLTISIT